MRLFGLFGKLFQFFPLNNGQKYTFNFLAPKICLLNLYFVKII